MTGEVALLESRRDEGGEFPVEAEKRKSRLDAVGAKSVVMRKYLLTLRSKRGMQAEQQQRGDSRPRKAARSVACQ